MKILSISDVELDYLYSTQVMTRFKDVDLVISCGDLSHYYLEYIITMLNRPLYYVFGNHTQTLDEGRLIPHGGMNLHNRTCRDGSGLLLAGIEGCNRYNYGPHQYSQTHMWGFALNLVIPLMFNRLFYGRYLDVLVTHASPWKIHDMEDLPHHGIKAFNWLIKVFQPAVHFHGHIHVYRQDIQTTTLVGKTRVINTYGFRENTIII
ncbi:MAG: metallophosphoesterase family protein [Anaerolineaceae bacterium]